MKKTTDRDRVDNILEVQQGVVEVHIVGGDASAHPSPGYICNRLSEKVQRELLMPSPKANAAERATRLKHDPYEEFRASPYRLPEGAPTLIAALSVSFKRAMMTAALDLPGAKKAQIGRLVWVHGKYTPLFGVPQITLDPVRSADMNRTPDIRSRAILTRWACRLQIRFSQPLIKINAITRLLAAAGLYVGVGDWRNEKGSGSFGGFRLVEPDDPEYLELVRTGDRTAQIEAMKAPEPYDEETADLLAWFDEEIARRRGKGVA